MSLLFASAPHLQSANESMVYFDASGAVQSAPSFTYNGTLSPPIDMLPIKVVIGLALPR
jgi:hypothetical protein